MISVNPPVHRRRSSGTDAKLRPARAILGRSNVRVSARTTGDPHAIKAALTAECQGELGVVCLLFAAKIRKVLDELDVEVNPSDNIKDPCTLQLGTVLERFPAPGSP